MTTPIARLLAAVEAGAPAKSIDFSAIGDYDDITLAGKSCDGDVTAAISLCGAMLPGVRIDISGPLDLNDWMVNMPNQDSVYHPILSRALLIALLRAMVAKEAM